MKRSPALLLVLALYFKLNGLKHNQFTISDIEVNDVIANMQYVTEIMDDEIETDEGLLTLGVQYALIKESYEKECANQASDYRQVYG